MNNKDILICPLRYPDNVSIPINRKAPVLCTHFAGDGGKPPVAVN